MVSNGSDGWLNANIYCLMITNVCFMLQLFVKCKALVARDNPQMGPIQNGDVYALVRHRTKCFFCSSRMLAKKDLKYLLLNPNICSINSCHSIQQGQNSSVNGPVPLISTRTPWPPNGVPALLSLQWWFCATKMAGYPSTFPPMGLSTISYPFAHHPLCLVQGVPWNLSLVKTVS